MWISLYTYSDAIIFGLVFATMLLLMGRRSLSRAIALSSLLALVAGFAAFLILVIWAPSPRSVARDAIVVLSGSEARTDTGIELLGHGLGERLLISGAGLGSDLKRLAERRAAAPDLFDERIDVDPADVHIRNTFANAAQTAAWAKRHAYKDLWVVTSPWHLPRSLHELGRRLPQAVLAPWPAVEGAGPGGAVLLGEYAKLWGARLGLSGLF